MESYLWQSALLMVAAYLLGAVLGCLFRRLFTSSAPVESAAPGRSPSPVTGTTATAASAMREAPEPVQPKIETVAHPTPPQEAKIADSARFERVLTSPAGAGSEAPPSANAKPAATAGPAPAAHSSPAVTAAATAATAAAAASAVAAVVDKPAEPASPPPQEPAPAPESFVPAAGGTTGLSAVAATISTTSADDLRRIADIDEQTATTLNQLGYTQFEQIAAWSPADAEKVRGALNNRPAREGWIEQAKILAGGQQTGHTKRLAGDTRLDPWTLPSLAAPPPKAEIEPAPAPPKPKPTTLPPPATSPNPTAVEAAITSAAAAASAAIAASKSAGEPAAPPPPPAAPVKVAPPAATPAPAPAVEVVPDDLLRIEGIDAATQKRLYADGIKTYAQIAGWTTSDVEKADGLIGSQGRVSRQNWIEQANILANDKPTLFSRRLNQAPPIAPRPDQPLIRQPLPSATGTPVAETPSPPSAPPSLSAGAAAAAAAAAASSAATPAKPAPAAPPANTAPPPAANTQPETPPRQGSPGTAARGASTAPLEGPSTPPPSAEPAPAAAAPASARPANLAEAIKQNTGAAGSGVAGMRSVKSQLLSGETGPKGDVDDLKKIRGIGVLIEKKLNAMGIYTYDQIANWSASDIDRISSSLDFKGRIEREGWVEQARILASGGQTEFSKRIT